MTVLLRVRGLHAGYGPAEVIKGADLDVEEGRVTVMLGANGAGKTTMLRAISGVISRHGEVAFDGREIVRHSPERIVRSGIAHVPQGRGTLAELSVEDNLRVGGYGRRSRDLKSEMERWFDTFPKLGDRRRQSAGQLSGGEQQMLAIARALMSKPRLLLCDEPSLGLAPVVTAHLFHLLGELHRTEGLAVLLVEQNANLAMQIATRVYILESGVIVRSGTAAEVTADDSVRRSYLGY